MEFEKKNVNPKGRKSDDCVIRALSTLSGLRWESIYKRLCELGLEMCRMPNEKATYEKWLKQVGYIKHKQPRREDGTKYTVEELVDELDVRNCVITVAQHMTVVEDGVLIDTWDCSQKTVCNYWTS